MQRGTRIPVTYCQRDDAPGSRQHLLRIHALMRIPLEITHLAVPVLREPIFKLSGVFGRAGVGEMAVVKAKFTRALTDGFFHRCAAWAT